MATLYRTKFGAFSVSHGYCGAVYDRDGKRDEESLFVTLPLMGVVRKDDLLSKDILRLETIEKDPENEYRLIFGSGSSTIMTDVVTSAETTPDPTLPPPANEDRITVVSGRPPPRVPFFPPSSES